MPVIAVSETQMQQRSRSPTLLGNHDTFCPVPRSSLSCLLSQCRSWNESRGSSSGCTREHQEMHFSQPQPLLHCLPSALLLSSPSQCLRSVCNITTCVCLLLASPSGSNELPEVTHLLLPWSSSSNGRDHREETSFILCFVVVSITRLVSALTTITCITCVCIAFACFRV